MKGEIKTSAAPREVEPKYVDAEIITDPQSPAYKASESARNVTPKENKEVSVKGEIKTSAAPRELEASNPKRIESPQPEAVQKAAIDTRAQKVIETLKGKDAVSVEQLQKLTKYNKNNVEDAILTLYAARQVEILPDNSVRFIGGETVKAEKSLLERAGEIESPKEPVQLQKSPIENEISNAEVENALPDKSSSLAENKNPQVSQNKAIDTLGAKITITDKNAPLAENSADKKLSESYQNLPEQKQQEIAPEKK